MTEHLVQQAGTGAQPVLFPEQEGIDLWGLIRTLWAGKWTIAGVTMLAGAAAVLLTMWMPNIYRSEALLAPAEDSGSGGLMALAGQLGGLASLAGVDLGKGKTTKVTIGLEVLKSRAFLSSFIARRNILVPLIAGKKWNPSTGQLQLNSKLYDEASQRWIGFGTGDGAHPSEWMGYKAFISILQVSQSKDTGLVTLSLDHPSPVLAQQWVAWLISDVNEQMRQRDIEEAHKSIDFLKQQLEQTPLSEMQQIFYQLIEKQTQTIMLANAREQYVFKVIDPPVVPEEKVSPRRASIVIMAVMTAFAASVGLVLVIAAYRNAGKRLSLAEGKD